jgi:hypothetical protein
MGLVIHVRGPGDVRERVPLARDVVKIGRAASCHVVLDDPDVARMHAVIEVTGEGDAAIIDLGSAAGTRVNGARVNRADLAVGDVVAIGPFELVLAREGEASVATEADGAAWRPVSQAVRDLVSGYAARIGRGASDLAAGALAHAPATMREASFFHVVTRLWWERRFFRYMGALETSTENAMVRFGSLALGVDALPDRWTLDEPRPEPFAATLRRRPLDVGVPEVELEVRFGVETRAAMFGDAAFPLMLLDSLTVDARFEGVDSVPVVKARGAAPYRAAAIPMDHPEVPAAVMNAIRAFVREIDLPGYTDRIHGWDSRVRGGTYTEARFVPGPPLCRRGEALTAIVLERTGFVYAPALVDRG